MYFLFVDKKIRINLLDEVDDFGVATDFHLDQDILIFSELNGCIFLNGGSHKRLIHILVIHFVTGHDRNHSLLFFTFKLVVNGSFSVIILRVARV